MNDRSEIKTIISAIGKADVDTLRMLARKYPFFTLPATLLVKDHAGKLDDAELASLRFHLAVATGDRRALYDMASDEGAAFVGFYPEQAAKPTVSTDSAIDTFFANYGSSDDSETALLERLIFNPAPDYAEILAQENASEEPTGDTTEESSQDARIAAFIRRRGEVEQPTTASTPTQAPQPAKQAQPEPKPLRPAAAASTETHDDSLLSESLAKIFIKQGRYERAYEIISNLSLNYPKKSIYFADQLRFLQKLIKIRQASCRGEAQQRPN